MRYTVDPDQNCKISTMLAVNVRRDKRVMVVTVVIAVISKQLRCL